MAESTSTASRRSKPVNPHAKALAAIRTRREAVKNKVYVAKRREFTV
jgi:hypothetical protein